MIKIKTLLFFLFLGYSANAQTKTRSKAEMDSATKLFFEDSKLESESKEIIQSPELDSLIKRYKKIDAANKTNEKSSDNYYFFHGIKLGYSDFNQLSPKEKFVYAFKYPEQYMQTCSIYSFDRYNAPFLHAQLPFATEGLTMSQRQFKDLKNYRLITIGYLNEIIKKATLIDNVFKHEIVDLDAFECVPNLLYQFKTGLVKDNYILTIGLLLMKKDSFAPFLQSDIYKKLYTEKGNWREKIDLTESVKTTTVDLIKKYYKWKLGQ